MPTDRSRGSSEGQAYPARHRSGRDPLDSNGSPSIALVTVLYGGEENFSDFFESLRVQTASNLHLYLIDNSPTQTTLEKALEFASSLPFPVHSLRNEENLGAAAANNQGIEWARNDGHDYILLLNNDIHFSEETIEILLRHAEEKEESILAPKFINDTTGRLWYAGGTMIHRRGINSHRGANHEDRGQFDEIEYVEYAPTTFLLIKRELFQEAGLLDEAYFAYFEDTDWIMRATRAGFRICYLPLAVVHHKVSSTTGGKQSDFSLYYLNRNRVYFIRKQYSGWAKVRAFIGASRERGRWYRSAPSEKRAVARRAWLDGFCMDIPTGASTACPPAGERSSDRSR